MPCSFCQSPSHVLSECNSVECVHLCESVYTSYFTDCMTHPGLVQLMTFEFVKGDARIQRLSRKELSVFCSKLSLCWEWRPEMKKSALTMIYSFMFRSMMNPDISDVQKAEYSEMLLHGRALPEIVADVIAMVEEEGDQRSQIVFRKAAWERRVNRMTDEEVVDFYDEKIRLDELDPLMHGFTPAMCRALLIGLHEGDVDSMYDRMLNEYWMENAVDLRFVNRRRRGRGQRLEQQKPAIRRVIGDSEKQMEECPVCYETAKDFVTTDCGHDLCVDCFEKIQSVNGICCPMCRSDVKEIVCYSNQEVSLL